MDKEAFIINKFFLIFFHQPKIAQKEVSYDFEILHGVLSNQNNKIAPFKKNWYPPFTPHYDIFWGELLSQKGLS